MKTTKFLPVCVCVSSLCACSTFEGSQYTNYPAYQYYPHPSTYFTIYGDVDYRYQRGEVNIPDSYHVGPDHSPVSHKNVDSTWVHSQNPQGYTIEVAGGEKASEVARKLYKVPKNDRTAQIKYHGGDGRAYYKGVYGSYNSYEEAQKALNNLPEDIKQGADIQHWGNIQNNAE
ncbi:Uncharacterised protein [Legionella lansingensis]|uniref:SPOR domain-containing protein n=1 Tax=Legionella lansingensis TaxID=45067 RepID=A0A0W0VUC1_9GAMM|nr:SPOR domain-containing protein [Legionella lansingensis]KTD23573.1 hypothetical protein Llan_0708 [Legionella lansingensis]SNV52303.1 Uncharacterised protein [Legionella lansingensis]